jgi:hypothetical protein
MVVIFPDDLNDWSKHKNAFLPRINANLVAEKKSGSYLSLGNEIAVFGGGYLF